MRTPPAPMSQSAGTPAAMPPAVSATSPARNINVPTSSSSDRSSVKPATSYSVAGRALASATTTTAVP